MNVLNQVLNNPTLRYRLDPGEPGLLQSSKASQSTMAVTAQEQRNLLRLKSEAAMSGRRVISSGIKYSTGIEGAFVATRAGLTTVVSEPVPQSLTALNDAIILDSEPVETILAKTPDTSAPTTQEAPDSIELEKSENQLQIMKNKLENDIDRKFAQSEEESNPAILKSVLSEAKDIGRRVEIINREIKRVEFVKMMSNISASQKSIANAVDALSKQPFGLAVPRRSEELDLPQFYQPTGGRNFYSPGQILNYLM